MISFVRIDDRMIHGQTCTRWAVEYPCDGLIAVNDAAAGNGAVCRVAFFGVIRMQRVRVVYGKKERRM